MASERVLTPTEVDDITILERGTAAALQALQRWSTGAVAQKNSEERCLSQAITDARTYLGSLRNHEKAIPSLPTLSVAHDVVYHILKESEGKLGTLDHRRWKRTTQQGKSVERNTMQYLKEICGLFVEVFYIVWDMGTHNLTPPTGQRQHEFTNELRRIAAFKLMVRNQMKMILQDINEFGAVLEELYWDWSDKMPIEALHTILSVKPNQGFKRSSKVFTSGPSSSASVGGEVNQESTNEAEPASPLTNTAGATAPTATT